MQAQAANSGAGNAPQSLLQNPKIQIGVVVAGAIALIVVIWMVFFPPGAGGGTTAPPPAGYPGTAPTVGGGPSGAAEGATPAAGAAKPATAPSAAPTPTAMGGPGATPGGAPGAAPGAAPAGKEAEKPSSPGVKTRTNPFAENTDLKKSIDTIPIIVNPKPKESVAPELDVYKELYKPKVDVKVTAGEDQNDGPPIPAMRVAGVIFGSAAGPTATMQIGDQFIQVTPGKMIPEGNPVYRVERIEQEKVVLSRRWELGSKHGVQRIEVTLAGSAARGGGAGGGMGYPGAGGGMSGYPGGMRGGYPGMKGLN